MSKVISDALQQIVRASQLGDVIVSSKLCSANTTPTFTVILSIFFNQSITIDAAVPTHSLVTTPSHNEGTGGHGILLDDIVVAPLFRTGVDFTVDIGGSFAIEAVPTYVFVGTPDQENLLSNVGSFIALDAVPSFDVT